VFLENNGERFMIAGHTLGTSWVNGGGFDWVMAMFDYKGRNQCSALNLVNDTDTIEIRTITGFSFSDVALDFSTISASTASTGAQIQSITASLNNFCSLFSPVVAEEGFDDQTLIRNTYVSIELPEFCDDQDTSLLSYELARNDGAALDSWINFDASTRTLYGTVPADAPSDSILLKLTATDGDGLSGSTTFYLHFTAKPVLESALPNFSIRAGEYFYYLLPKTAFDHPDGDTFTMNITNVPSWLTHTNTTSRHTFSGTPTEDDIGTYTIRVTATDSLGGQTSTTFQIEVIKNFYPVINN